MSDFAGIMSEQDIHKLKLLSIELQKFVNEDLAPMNSMLSNDWRRIKDLLNKVTNDQRKIYLLDEKSKQIIKNINLLFNGEVKK